jgi:hypothetical protein
MMNIRSVVATSLLVFGAAAAASAQNPARPGKGHAHAQRARAGQARGPGLLVRGLFRGITLTDTEKANIKNVHAKYAPQMKALREQFKAQRRVAAPDTTARTARRQANLAQRAQVEQLIKAERNDLRAALTPENQARFDANAKKIEDRLAQRLERIKNRVGK